MMAFYDSVKDKVRSSSEGGSKKEEDKEKKRGDKKVAFEQLKKNSKDRKKNLEPEDDSKIEDLSKGGLSSGKGDYGDLSSIELKEDAVSQAGKPGSVETNTSEGTKGIRDGVGRKVEFSKDSEDVEKTSESGSGPKEVLLTADGGVKDPAEEDVETAGSTEIGLLRDIREQNSEIIEILRDIRNSL